MKLPPEFWERQVVCPQCGQAISLSIRSTCRSKGRIISMAVDMGPAFDHIEKECAGVPDSESGL